ncbi:MAG: MerR family transcriptional regulator [Ferruginibacter sp.]
MAKQTQIAFDFFGDAPAPAAPAPEKKTKPRKEVIVDVPQQVTVPVIKKKSTRGRKSLKEMAQSVDLVEVPDDEILFQKMYYSIGKVAEMFKVNQSLIRLWEREFDVLKPKKNGKGDRLFRPEDIKNIQLIHHLTREKKYTMEGAKEYFRNNKKADEKFAVIESLKKIKGFLNELKANM